jgi:opacity protein-like surface antigen
MRSTLLTVTAAVALLTAIGSANAFSPTTQSGLREAADTTNLTDNVAWTCWRNWRGFRRCAWRPGYRYGYYGRPWRYRY